MTDPAGARPKARASSFDPNQPRDSRGRWSSSDAKRVKDEWTNLRSNAGSPASLPLSASDLATRRAKAQQSSRAQSRASSVGGRSVQSIPENKAVSQEVSPVPPGNRNEGPKTRSESPVPKSSTERFDMTLADSPPQAGNNRLMDEMQDDLDGASSVVSNSSSTVEMAMKVASGLLQSMSGVNPYETERSLENSDNTNGFGVIPDLPFQSSADVTNAAQSAKVGVMSTPQNNEPGVDSSIYLRKEVFEEHQHILNYIILLIIFYN